MQQPKNILVVEDDLNLGFLLVELLEGDGYNVKLCKDGKSGLQTLERRRFDLCILDIMLPEMDGFTVAKNIRRKGANLPILFLTAKTLKEDKMKGYECGADDYITKPFDEDVLLCKLRVIMRRHQESEELDQSQQTYKIGQYEFHYHRQELIIGQDTQRITEKENEILRLLCQYKNQILRRDQALEQVYGRRDYFLGRSFDVFISRLRKLLRHDPTVSIENVYKVGFILQVNE